MSQYLRYASYDQKLRSGNDVDDKVEAKRWGRGCAYERACFSGFGNRVNGLTFIQNII